MSLSRKEDIRKQVQQKFENENTTYLQYLHYGFCKFGPCGDVKNFSNDLYCAPFEWCIHASNQLHKLPKHPNCDCVYQNVPIKSIGSVSKRQPAPDVWLKLFGKLPDYYITKDEAKNIYGWDPSKNTLAGKAPGKMIGDEPYRNDMHRLPEKEGRTWKYCDVDYESGGRSDLRLFYSSDGLMFYSKDHGDTNFYWIK